MDEIETLANAPLARKTFNFADMIRDRTYPELVVPVYVDEAKALRLVEINEAEAAVDRKVARRKGAMPSDEHLAEFAALNDEREAILEEMQSTKYIALVRGFNVEVRQELLDAAYEQIPLEYKDVVNSITGVATQVAVEDPKRATLFNDMLWNKSIVSFTAPDGAVSEHMTVDETHALRVKLPNATRNALDAAIEKVQMASNWYLGLADEVF